MNGVRALWLRHGGIDHLMHEFSLTIQEGMALMMSMIERAKTKPSADLLGKLAGGLGCDMDDLHA